jgi:hypothetical protein
LFGAEEDVGGRDIADHSDDRGVERCYRRDVESAVEEILWRVVPRHAAREIKVTAAGEHM